MPFGTAKGGDMDFNINEVYAEVGKLYLTVAKLTAQLAALSDDKKEDPEA